MKRFAVRFSAFAIAVGFAVLAINASGHGWKQSGFPEWRNHARGDGHGNFFIDRNWLSMFAAKDAFAQNTGQGGAPAAPSAAPSIPGGSAGGAGAAPRKPYIGQTTVGAGSTTIIIPAAGWSPAVYTHCFASVLSPLPPVAGDLPGCQVTSTATIVASATATVGAVNVQVAGTPSPSPVVQYMLTQ